MAMHSQTSQLHAPGLFRRASQRFRFGVRTAAGEAICGVAAVILAVAGLAQADWAALPPIVAIVLGAGLIFEGFAASYRSPVPNAERESPAVISTELLGGIVGVTFGVLAILGIAPSVLLPVTVIAFGISLVVGSVASKQFHSLHTATGSAPESVQFVPLPDLTFAASGAQSLAGLVATVLGIVALFGQETPSRELTLSALLIVGAYLVLISTDVARYVMRIRARHQRMS